MKTTTAALSTLMGLLIITATMLPLRSASASHITQIGLIEQTWDGVAIKGYDPVAYFNKSQAVKGSETFQHEWLGQLWNFSSAENLALFKADPVKYVPQFGGYCSDSHNVADINPTAWRIVNARLYLFYSESSADKFSNDGYALSKAEEYWSGVKAGLSQ